MRLETRVVEHKGVVRREEKRESRGILARAVAAQERGGLLDEEQRAGVLDQYWSYVCHRRNLAAGRRYKHPMTNLTLAPLTVLLCLAGAARAQPSQAFIESADKSVPSALGDYNVPGLAVALIRNGAVVWMKGYGFADAASAKPITPDTAFNIGSLSKTATA